MNAIQMLVDDHLRVEGLFRRYEAIADRTSRTKKESAKRALLELEIHSKLEEEIFYPAMRQVRSGGIQKAINESVREHQATDALIEELKALDPESDQFDAGFQILVAIVERHLREEENEVLPAAQAKLSDQLDRLGQQMMERKQQLLGEMQRAGRRAEEVLAGQRVAAVPVGQLVQVGMSVVSLDGATVGQVKKVRANDCLVDRTLARDVYVPFTAIKDVSHQTIRLNITADQVDAMGWEQPPLAA